MKKAIAVSYILSLANLIIGSIFLLLALLLLILMPILPILISAVLIGCIILHSYAALQLRKSVFNDSLPLNKQTPVGIKLMGYMALFFAMMSFMSTVFTLQHIEEILKQAQLPKEIRQVDMRRFILASSIISLFFSLSVILNVILNLRLLKWYTLTHNSESK